MSSLFTGNSKDTIRAQSLLRRRQEEHDLIEERKRKIESRMMRDIDHKFNAVRSIATGLVSEGNVAAGLVTFEDLKKNQSKTEAVAPGNQHKRKKSEAIIEVNKLSFLCEEEDVDEVCCEDKKYFGKNPDVDTSFLPDRKRDQEEIELREQLKKEWLAEQDKIKAQSINIVFSYWDGSGHPRALTMRKGNTIQQFLMRSLDMLKKENLFIELKSTSIDQLIFVKDDIILPHHLSFYDFIVMEAYGKHGQKLFEPESTVSRRLTNDAVIDEDDVHSGKVLLRSWFERNKHIFPACRWEPFDPEKKSLHSFHNISPLTMGDLRNIDWYENNC